MRNIGLLSFDCLQIAVVRPLYLRVRQLPIRHRYIRVQNILILYALVLIGDVLLSERLKFNCIVVSSTRHRSMSVVRT
jgi:hypothetical protein